MICNERQYKITVNQIDNLREALTQVQSSDQPEWLSIAQVNALRSQIQDLQEQVTEYELLKEGKVRFFESSDLSNLPKALIQARIANGLSQKELAQQLNLTMQQIQRYEASNYMGASLSRLIDVARILGVTISEAWGGRRSESGNSVFVWEQDSYVDWERFPIKEMIQRGWLNPKNKQSPAQAVKDYFVNAAGAQYASALHRKKFYGGTKPNEYSLLAWQARVLEKSRHDVEAEHIPEFNHRDDWLKELVGLSTQDDSPKKVKSFLQEQGICLVVEKHLQGTYLDGAAMLLETGNPVIALTLRHDRLDNFWFVLFHELGHVFLHLFDSLKMDFFDEQNGDSGSEDVIENEADRFALDNLIPIEKWEDCLSRFSLSEQAVIIDAQALGIHPSIVAGRIRKERNNYTVLNGLVGRGEVRVSLGE